MNGQQTLGSAAPLGSTPPPQMAHHLHALPAPEDGWKMLLTTHYLEEAEALCQRIAMLKLGRVIALDRLSTLLRNAAAKVLYFKTDDALPPDQARLARVTGRIVELPVQDTDEIERQLAALRQGGVRVEDLEIRKADLEDVFITLMSAPRDSQAAALETAP